MTAAIRWTEEQLAAYAVRCQRSDAKDIASAGKKVRRPAKPKAPRKSSPLEVEFAGQLAAHGVAIYLRDYRFLPGRKFELDFAWPDHKIAAEIQGNVHRIQGRFYSDCEKLSLAVVAGWRVLLLARPQIMGGDGVQWLENLLSGHDHGTLQF